MELKDRIKLLDILLVQNQQAGLPEDQVTGLVSFLAAMPGTDREAILEYIQSEDSDNRFRRFAELANMEPAKRDKILKAMGLQTADPKGFFEEFFGATGESTARAKRTIKDLADMRSTVQENFLEPIARLFGRGKTGNK